MACNNPSYINTTNVNNFGFTTVFDPYAKTVKFDISDLTTFKSGGAANITSIVFTVVNSNGSTYTGTINPSVSLAPLTISGLDGGQLFFGQYTITAVLTEANASTYSIQQTPNVCADNRLEYGNFINACIEATTDCGSAKLVIKDMTNKQYAGLSPKENREIPPLDYPRVYQLKRDFPHLTMSINGGIKSLEEAKAHLQHMDGVMVGREAYQNPGILAAVDREIFGSSDTDADPVAVVRAMYPYIERELSQGTYLGHITRHMLGLFQGIPGARQWRRYLSENAHKAGADINVLEHALKLVADKR